MIIMLPGVDSPVEVDTSATGDVDWGIVGGALILTAVIVFITRALVRVYHAAAPYLLGAITLVAVLAALAGVGVSVDR